MARNGSRGCLVREEEDGHLLTIRALVLLLDVLFTPRRQLVDVVGDLLALHDSVNEDAW